MNSRYLASNSIALALASMLAGCSTGSQSTIPGPQGATLPGASAHVRTAHRAAFDANRIAPQFRVTASQPQRTQGHVLTQNSTAQTLFTSSFGNFSDFGVIDDAAVATPPGGTLASFFTGVDNPGNITAANGELYVANSGASNILVLRNGQVVRTLTDPFEFPTDIAITKTGALYVANIFSSPFAPGNVSVYPPGANQPASTLTSPTFNQLLGIAVNRAGTVFVSNNQQQFKDAQLIAFPHGTGTGIVMKNIVMNIAGGLAIDPKTQDLLVMDQGAKFVSVYAAPYTGRAKAVYAVPIGGAAVTMTLDSTSSNLYFADVRRNGVDVISYPAGKFLGSYTGAFQPTGVAVL